MITFPNGEMTLLEPGNPIPEIPADAVLEVFGGQFTVKTDKGEAVKVSCLGHQGTAEGGSSVTLSCRENSGVFRMIKGSARLVDQNGKEIALEEGKDYPLKIFPDQNQPPQAAPATAAGTPTGGPPAGGDLGDAPAVDSRSVESSPSQ